MGIKRISMAAGLFAVGLFAAACGGSEGIAPAQPAFKDMDFGERVAFMQDVVLPEMTDVFVAFDPKFAGMGCNTCHGDGARDGSFAMPSPQVPVLPGTEEAFIEYAKDPEHGRWAQFMFEEVTSRMADLLQVAQYDPMTHTGAFSCHNCHTLDGVQP
jgi:hypothetical protein